MIDLIHHLMSSFLKKFLCKNMLIIFLTEFLNKYIGLFLSPSVDTKWCVIFLFSFSPQSMHSIEKQCLVTYLEKIFSVMSLTSTESIREFELIDISNF
jgi:hypothetical protein